MNSGFRWGTGQAPAQTPATPPPPSPSASNQRQGWGGPFTAPSAQPKAQTQAQAKQKPTTTPTSKRSDIIVKAAAKGKFVDFRNALVPAFEQDYAMIHGCGGKKHASRSCIKLFLTDYSAGTGDRAITVSANVGPEFIPYAFAVCEKNVGELPQNARDFSYRQERVNAYRKRQDGFVFVSVLSFNRQGIRPQSGEVSRLPWSINIENFWARPKPQKNGTTAYDATTIDDKKSGFILLSDADMFRCLVRCNRFIELWELACGMPIIKKGLADKEAERQQSLSDGYNNQ